MPCDRVDIAMHIAVHDLVTSLSGLDRAGLTDRLARAAATVTGTAYAGFVRVDPLREVARLVHVHGPPGDPLRVRPWLTESGVLKILTVSPGSARLPRDPSVGEPGFLATPVPLATREHVLIWVAGRAFRDCDEHLLSRLATAAGRALEAASGMEAAVRILRAVHTFTGGWPPPPRRPSE
ncbi:hypothetical protein [Nonomuraea lactucae]|uniref:hypothetical protein n=1 Tax=Nonomuraea lactucae TaxID=2249762 RepID=UPI000DE22B8D|nr:hypothetical protein [Nonomuraea lactucae]